MASCTSTDSTPLKLHRPESSCCLRVVFNSDDPSSRSFRKIPLPMIIVPPSRSFRRSTNQPLMRSRTIPFPSGGHPPSGPRRPSLLLPLFHIVPKLGPAAATLLDLLLTLRKPSLSRSITSTGLGDPVRRLTPCVLAARMPMPRHRPTLPSVSSRRPCQEAFGLITYERDRVANGFHRCNPGSSLAPRPNCGQPLLNILPREKNIFWKTSIIEKWTSSVDSDTILCRSHWQLAQPYSTLTSGSGAAHGHCRC